MAVVANQAVAFDKSMLMACPHLGDVLRPGLIPDHGLPFPNPVGEGCRQFGSCPWARSLTPVNNSRLGEQPAQ